jgi:ATP-dependent protease ClpP protease subunit
MNQKKEGRTRAVEPDFDPGRAIFISGEIDEDLVTKVSREILLLHHASGEPITVFIDSPGGSVAGAATIAGLLRNSGPHGTRRRIYTVATGRACSAAADLLAMGDYIAAYQHSYILFHGVRAQQETVTAESASEIETALLSDNLTAAGQLAGTVLNRWLYIYSKLREEIKDARAQLKEDLSEYDLLVGANTIDLPCFALALSQHVGKPYNDLLQECLGETAVFHSVVADYRKTVESPDQLARPVAAALKEGRQDKERELQIRRQAHLLDVLLANRLARDENWLLSEEDFTALGQSFRDLQKVADGFFQDDLLDQLTKYFDLFVPKKDRDFLNRHNNEKDLDDPKFAKALDEIVERANAKIEPLWTFTVAFCRRLNIGENSVSPADAWWLGLIDEVIGTPLVRRTLPERTRQSLRKQLPMADSARYDC